jgi:hypothetical protein
MKSIATIVAIGILAISPSAFASKVDVCHRAGNSGRFVVINVNTNSLDAHLGNHGDSYAGTYWRDADGDGHGDPNGETDRCPNVGFVANADDCDDSDALTSPGREEACGDATDNNCDGAVDEACLSCPCFTLEDVEAAYADADVETLSNTICEISWTMMDVWWDAWWRPFPEEQGDWSAREFAVFASYETWFNDEPYCYYSWNEIYWSEGNVWSYEGDQYEQYITLEEHQQCVDIMFQWAENHDLSCIDYTLPPEEL